MYRPVSTCSAQVRRLLDSLLREAAQKRQDVALATFGGMTAECVCLPIVDASGRLVKRNLLPEVRASCWFRWFLFFVCALSQHYCIYLPFCPKIGVVWFCFYLCFFSRSHSSSTYPPLRCRLLLLLYCGTTT